MRNATTRTVLVLFAVTVLVFNLSWAQQGTSTIRGTVTDPQGSVVVGAKVTITNVATGLTRTQQTTNVGAFAFELIPPGQYKVEIEATNFKRSATTVRAQVGLPTEASAQLAIGDTSQVVEVSASVVEVNRQDATLGNNFLNEQITQLPLEARDVTALLTLQPGVTREGYVAGARSDQSNVTLDGVDINEAQTNALGGIVLRLNQEAIQEFRVQTVNSNASQGRSSGAQVNLVTKGGSNTWHGSAFEFYRSTGFTANTFFNNRATPKLPNPKLIRHTYAGSLSGPIVKDKLFFMYSFEGGRRTEESSRVRTVPLASMGQGNLLYRDASGTVQTLTTAQLDQAFPSVLMNPAAISVLAAAAAAYPANDNTVGDGLNYAGYRFNAPTPQKLASHVARMDYNLSSTQTLFARANVINDNTSDPPQFPDTPAPGTWSHPWGGVVGHTWALSSTLVNNFRYGYTRQAFSTLGDSDQNAISFRFIFSPRAFSRTLSRTTPVHNLTNDMSWIKGSHTFQFGTSIWITRNGRVSYANAYDNAVANPTFYASSGAVILQALDNYLATNGLPAIGAGSRVNARDTASALIGRFSQYTANFTFGADGTLLSSGTPTDRTFATEQYDFYFQDSWRLRPSLTLTYGLRWGIGSPVYETNGFELKPDISLSKYFDRRVEAAKRGQSFVDPISMVRSGKANGASPMYPWDKNNFQPRVAIAWSPTFDGGIGKWIFGSSGRSSLRSGFAMTNDYFGQSLAVAFDLNNQLGFTSGSNINANTYNVTTRPAPQFTGFGQAVRPLPGIVIPGNLTFPRQEPSDLRRRIQGSLDEGLVAPTNYQWNLTFEREMPAGMIFQTSYVGRLGRNLLATRDVMALNNLVDPVSGMDWYTAATTLEQMRQQGVPSGTGIANIPYFENVFPANLAAIMGAYYGCCIPAGLSNTQTVYYLAEQFFANDWTFVQDEIEQATGISMFYQPQYGALSAWGTIASSDYHALTASLRQRHKAGLSWDLNYTFSHSIDDASGLQTSGSFGTAFILNPIKQRLSRANSDFDTRHQINMNALYDLPFGKGKLIGGNVSKGWDALIGGWQLGGIFRWNTGLPISAPFDQGRWATNWNLSSNTTRRAPVKTCPTRGSATAAPKLFGCDPTGAYRSFRSAYPGEAGERNIFRLPGYVVADMGLTKNIRMPYNESHKLQLRWEVFNVTNTQRLGGVQAMPMVDQPPVSTAVPPSSWSNFTSIQGDRRVMQIGARFEF